MAYLVYFLDRFMVWQVKAFMIWLSALTCLYNLDACIWFFLHFLYPKIYIQNVVQVFEYCQKKIKNKNSHIFFLKYVITDIIFTFLYEL